MTCVILRGIVRWYCRSLSECTMPSTGVQMVCLLSASIPAHETDPRLGKVVHLFLSLPETMSNLHQVVFEEVPVISNLI